MNSISTYFRAARVPRAAMRTRVYKPTTSITKRFAATSYGGDEQSGQAKSDAPNPKVDMEHPGPPPPDTSSSKPSSSKSSKSTPTSHSKEGSGDKGSTSSSGSGKESQTKDA